MASDVPGLPARLVVAGQTFRVERIAVAADAGGRVDVDAGVMRLRGGGEISADQQRDTLLHEVIHAVLAFAKLDDQRDHFKSHEASERIVTVLSTHLLDTLRRNPELVAYLMATDDPG